MVHCSGGRGISIFYHDKHASSIIVIASHKLLQISIFAEQCLIKILNLCWD